MHSYICKYFYTCTWQAVKPKSYFFFKDHVTLTELEVVNCHWNILKYWTFRFVMLHYKFSGSMCTNCFVKTSVGFVFVLFSLEQENVNKVFKKNFLGYGIKKGLHRISNWIIYSSPFFWLSGVTRPDAGFYLPDVRSSSVQYSVRTLEELLEWSLSHLVITNGN
jgi:hypothetical protein